VRPTTKFAKLGNDRIGYQVLGEGPIDLVFLTGMSSHIDLRWEEPLNEYFLHRLASFSRLILFDRRGTGVSDPVPFDHLPTWEEWADDMRVVFDAVASERAAIVASLDGGPMAMLFAATYPERTAALVLAHTGAKYVRTEDYPHGFTPAVAEQLLHMVEELWGTEGFVSIADRAVVRTKASGNGMGGTCGRRRGPVRLRPSFAMSSRPTSGLSCPSSTARLSCSTGADTRSSRWIMLATSPSTSRTRGSSSCRGRTVSL
jgi:pimeloyl-ACP methyl ester carboxylesterase